MAPTLEQVMTLRVFRSKEDDVGFGATQGNALRFIQPLTSGFLKGDGFEAEFVQGGSDWIRFDQSTGTAYLDARLAFREKATGDLFYTRFPGIVRLDEKIQLVIEFSPEAKTSESKEHYNFVTPVFEVSNEKYKWMERTVFVGHGHYVHPGDGTSAVEYEIYQLITG